MKFGLFLTALATVSGIAFNTSCRRDPKIPSKTNFRMAIQDSLDKQPACISVSVPQEIEDFHGQHHKDDNLEALIGAGLVQKSFTQVKQSPLNRGFGDPPNKTVPGVRYDLTDKSQKYIRNSAYAMALGMLGGSIQSLCFAEKKVVDVVRYTEPTPTMGMTISQVTYTYTLTNVADWAERPAVQEKLYTGQQLAAVNQPEQAQMTLVLSNDGWHVPNHGY